MAFNHRSQGHRQLQAKLGAVMAVGALALALGACGSSATVGPAVTTSTPGSIASSSSSPTTAPGSTSTSSGSPTTTGGSTSTTPNTTVGTDQKVVVYKALEVTVPKSWQVVNQLAVCGAPTGTVDEYTLDRKLPPAMCPLLTRRSVSGVSLVCLRGAAVTGPVPSAYQYTRRMGSLVLHEGSNIAYVQGRGWREEALTSDMLTYGGQSQSILRSVRLSGHSC